MNNGMMGFPGGGAQGDIVTLPRKWWNYVQGAAAVPNRPTRAYDTWYYNDTGEDLDLSIHMYGANTGISMWVGVTPISVSSLDWSVSMSHELRERVTALGMFYGTNNHHIITAKIPPAMWYVARLQGGASMYAWAELRRKP